jgi:serine/threonine-protein kinase
MGSATRSCSSCDTPLPADAAFCPACGTATPTDLNVAFGEGFHDRLQATLADRYRIERELGQGGMAVVFLAHDLKHHRDVALKVMRPELATSIGADRFLREVRIAAQLSHPHILGVHDSGDAAGFLYYVMPVVQGESLRERLNRQRQLPIDEACAIAQGVAAALTHAHAHGVVHRDIKPENILLHDGEAVVTDFGVARAASEVGDRLTETGLVVGTPLYMSPEQASGEKEITGQSDLYSLGCVLYEMLAGEPPYAASAAQAIIAKKLSEPVPRVSVLRDTVSPAVEAVLDRALSRTPADRYATVEQFATELTASARTPASRIVSRRNRHPWLPYTLGVAAVAAVVAAALLAGVPQRFLGPAPAADSIRAVAVLPFENLGGGEEREAFIAGLHHDLLTHLNRIEGLAVRSRTSVLAFVDRGMSLGEIGRALEVDAVMEGGVQWADGLLRVTAQLIDVETDEHIWADQFDHETVTDLLTTQTAIVRRIASELGVRLSAEASERVARRPTESDEAYDLYLRAYPLVAESRDIAAALALLERAVALDPDFALAYGLFARAILWNRVNMTYGEAIDSGIVLARRAVSLDPDIGETHAALGLTLDAKMQFDEAERYYRRSMELSPGDAFAYLTLGEMKTTLGELEEAHELIVRAQVLDPTLRPVGLRLAEVLLEQRKYDQAIEVASAHRSTYPEYRASTVAQILGWAYVARGRYEDAVALDREHQRRVDADPQSPADQRGLAECGPECVMALAGMGDTAAARAALLVLEQERRAGYEGRGARAYVALGEYDRAFELLDWRVDRGHWRTLRLLTHPFWDPIRSDPRFDALLVRTGLR